MDEKIVPENSSRKNNAFRIGAAVILVLAAAGAALFLVPQKNTAKIAFSGASAAATVPPATHLPAPPEVRGVYLVAATAGNASKFDAIADAVKKKGVNALVVDLKNTDGSLAFVSDDVDLKTEAGKTTPLKDLAAFAAKAHELGFYLIGRMPVFEDPNYALGHPALALKTAGGKIWTDRNGLAWLDPDATAVWDYDAAIARAAYAAGFDEIQFDYVRFATDGATSKIVFPIYDKTKETMREVISRFFSYLGSELKEKGIPVSVDVFGFVTWHQNDLGIGQWYDDAVRSANYVSPMVYPSHYPTGVLKFKNPAEHPYEIISDSLMKGNEVIGAALAGDPSLRIATQRPWLQAFDMGAKYTPAMIMDEVRAARDNKSSGFLFWNARNDYSNLPDLSQ
jgi:hypothetical protein